MVNKFADLTQCFVAENTSLLHDSDGINDSECIASNWAERVFAHLFYDAPILCVLNLECETEQKQNLGLIVGCLHFVGILVPLSHIEDKLVDNWVIIFEFSVRHRALQEGIIHKIGEWLKRKLFTVLFIKESLDSVIKRSGSVHVRGWCLCSLSKAHKAWSYHLEVQ